MTTPSFATINPNSAQIIASSLALGSENSDLDSMTPDALLLYLNTRMGAVDGQMKDIFDRQKNNEKVRTELRGIQQILAGLETSEDERAALPLDATQIFEHIENIAKYDQKLADKLTTDLTKEGQILSGSASDYTTAELDATKDYLKLVNSDLESGSQMDMITLQSLMGARQTAIQLSTNLISALNESEKSVVSNIR